MIRRAAPPAMTWEGTCLGTDRMVVEDLVHGQWLAMQRVASTQWAGNPNWTITGRHEGRAAAEASIGLHDAPISCWMLHDMLLGWRHQNGRAWLHAPSPDTGMTEVKARAIAAAEPHLRLYVLRDTGMVTCPDLDVDFAA